MRKLLEQRVAGDIALAEAYKKQTGKRGFFNQQYLYENKVSSVSYTHLHVDTLPETILKSSFPCLP